MNIKKHTRSGVKWTTASTAVTAASQLLKIAILTRFLAKSDFGLFAIVMFVLGLCSLFSDMGLTSAILHRQNITREEYSSLYWVNFIFSFILYFIVCALTPFISHFYNETELMKILPTIAISLILSAIGRQFKTISYKDLKFKLVSIIEILSEILSLVLAIVLSINNFGIYSLVYSMLLQFFVTNFSLFIIVGLKQENRIMFHFDFNEIKSFLKIGFYQVGGQVANYFNGEFDILIVGKILGADVLGGYSLAKQLVSKPMGLINPVLTKVASPVLAILQHNLSDLKREYLKLVSIVSIINLIVYVSIIIFATPIVTLIYGSGYGNIIILVRILSVYMFLRSIGNPIGSLLTALGRTDLDFRWNITVLFVMPLFVWVGSQWGVISVAYFVLLSFILLFPLGWYMLVRSTIHATFNEYISAIFNYSLINRFKKNID